MARTSAPLSPELMKVSTCRRIYSKHTAMPLLMSMRWTLSRRNHRSLEVYQKLG
jgi:hypothetical protein